jgi:hypothetical protein
MARSTEYHFLLSSLPHLFSLFETAQSPISELRLQDRLRLLTPADAATLTEIEDLLLWHRLPIDTRDETLVARADELVGRLPSRALRGIVDWHMQERTLLAALRRRSRGELLPREGPLWGYGPLTDHIYRNYRSPAFGLELYFPWLPQAEKLVAEKDALELARLRLRLAWNFLHRTGEGHYFDFEALVVYVLKWHLLDARLRFDGAAARERFDRMLGEGMKGASEASGMERALA